jgi:uncharacterized membrane protein YkoI
MPLVLPSTRRIVSLLLLAAAALNPVGASADCTADWSIAAPIVYKEGLTTVETLSRIAAAEMPGNIVKTTLCEENGVFVYRILVRDAHGKLTGRTVDARAPFAR